MQRVPAPWTPAGKSSGRRTGIRAVALSAVGCVALAACSSASASKGSGGSADGKAGAAAKSAQIAITPGGEGSAVAVDRIVTVQAGSGKLTSVKVTADGPGALAGALSKDKGTWTSSAKLAPGVTYRVEAQAIGADGKQRSKSATFTTAEPSKDQTFVGEYFPDMGTTVGVAMPVSIVFNKPIHDKAAIERRLKVTSSPAVEGAWSWMKNRDRRDRIDFRPKAFWKPGTDITLRMSLDGVDAGGVYGTQNRVVTFRIGAAVTSTVDVVKKTLTVFKDGKKVRTLPVSTGKKGFETWNGTMVVLSKVPTIRMNSRTVGIFGPEAYDLGSVKWDVQLTPSGTYVHAAPWNAGKFGRINGSHGCIGMSTADAKWFYGQVGLGDPVTVIKSKDTVAVNNGYGDWNVDWTNWQQGSALK
ncbi:Ig-like domain-containing protein [Streptomyces sp. NPDC059690]|uniref:L,D-transpeptidase n=1 Tax=Streptomyces sp. NPDC059690 TaxID=3346907 RepID=UPI0036B445A7